MTTIVTIAGRSFEHRSRAEWGAIATSIPQDGDGQPEPKGYLHHEGGGVCPLTLTVDQEIAKMRAFQKGCIGKNGWSDIPYNLCVFPGSGRVYGGRGWRSQSGATMDENAESKAVLIFGNFDRDDQPYPTKGLEAAALVFAWGVQIGELVRTPRILGHRENPDHPGATSCPGKAIDMDAFRVAVAEAVEWRPPGPTPPPTPQPQEADMPFWKIKDHPEFQGLAVIFAETAPGLFCHVGPTDAARYAPEGTSVNDWAEAQRSYPGGWPAFKSKFFPRV